MERYMTYSALKWVLIPVTSLTIISLLGLSNAKSIGKPKSKPLSFGVVPQQAPRKLARLWIPIMKDLSAEIDHPVEFKTSSSINKFEKKLAQSGFDIAYMNPYHYTYYHEKSSYDAIAKAKDKKIKGIIVVRKDSPLKSLEDFRGKKLAFPSKGAFAASIIPQATFSNMAINITPSYMKSHDSVYLGVNNKLYEGGGGVLRTFNSTKAKVQENLRIIWESPGYTPHAVAIHSRIQPALKEKIQRALLKLNQKSEMMMHLNKLKIKGFVEAHNSDWDDVRSLNINTELGI